MRFKEYYLEEAVTTGKDPRAKEKVEFFRAQLTKATGLKLVTKKRQSDWLFIFKSKGLNLGETSLRLGSSFGDSLFGQTSGVFLSQGAGDVREKIQAAYEKKFGARGQKGEKTFGQLKKEFEKRGGSKLISRNL